MSTTTATSSPIRSSTGRRLPRVVRLVAVPALTAVGTVAVLALPAAAQTAPLTCGAVLTGDVRLTADLVDCPGPGLVIGASGVTIDLAGHTIDGTGTDAGIDNGAGHDRVVARGGTIQEFLFGVHLFETTGARLERVTVRANVDGVKVSRSKRLDIDDVTASSNAVNGIEITFSERTTVQRSTAADNGLFGIVDRFSANSRHEQNSLRGNAAVGLTLDRIDGGTVARNTATGNAGDGIQLVDVEGVTVVRNAALSNEGTGISVSGTVRDGGRNVANGNAEGDCSGLVC